jgi:glycosyltransferase involved in cell wall biosynthesis
MDLAPALFPDVAIHKDPGCNVAYWNLKHRQPEKKGDRIVVNEAPLTFFHYSGYNPEHPYDLSRHQDRFRLADFPVVRELFEEYRRALVKHGYEQCSRWPYAYDFFDNGIRIPPAARYLWREIDSDGNRWPSPRSASHQDDFFYWLNQPGDTSKHPILLTNLSLEVYRQRVDLQRAFPRILDDDREAFALWFVDQGARDEKIESFFVKPVRNSLEQPRTAPDGPVIGDRRRSPRWGVRLYFAVKRAIERLGLLPRLRGLVGVRRMRWVRDRLLRVGDFRARLEADTVALPRRPVLPPTKRGGGASANRYPWGLNVIGYLQDESGVGEVARSILKALSKHPVSLSQINLRTSLSRQNDTSVLHLPEGARHGINLVHVNADQVFEVFSLLGSAVFDGRHNIGFWFWELSGFPANWHDRFEYFDELWVASAFLEGALRVVAPIPVARVPIPVVPPPFTPLTRDQLGLPTGKRVFLFVFDALSFIERKNPFGLIQAYRDAFGPSFRDTLLVIKAINLDRDPAIARRLRREMKTVDGLLLDCYMDRIELYALFTACDAYVSLHRSEGFGLTMAEAMALGKPVIATAYAGNMDFMTEENSYLVPYRLVEITEDIGPYERGNVWADPDLTEATRILRRVVEVPEEARQKGERARQHIADNYNYDSVARCLLARLADLNTSPTGDATAPRARS